MNESRLRGIEATWRLNADGSRVTPAAHIAGEQVEELITEVKRLRTVLQKIAIGEDRMQGATVPYCQVCKAYGTGAPHEPGCVLTGKINAR